MPRRETHSTDNRIKRPFLRCWEEERYVSRKEAADLLVWELSEDIMMCEKRYEVADLCQYN
jgi:hypothetical protein